ncbi:multidrug ABC transporter ATP-binding protein [Mycobacterium colombiense]|uniref:Multidrug ABC transporter ATP-binding protein n=2 Tax=Mycobacterium colombiense TaxID=339268 RepID=A0A853LSE9_9MYCO|nr:ABC transporter ATP-binding protein/permease [Mycobacterium colombiense]OBJ18643.1 multidrug ABC transporter ATP-binding protein [Mycobacterium colombiense]OBJ39012.1 multidrug ABC transporter ATP-binding protein [Mycobacterium colombiense]OBJ46948.1 multidrug ABC transporter ATP-binding protein [Mycobacterium colombiense]OBJ56887.1 multidrug ABC transporter ATP-binding protein [Mycobacterium colombiense]OBJ76671.1 multidrug ABC transporter ATP-binding protein [Mycobacterium colombiense]
MGPKPFTPSIDWSTATMDSLRWLAIAWVIGAVCLLVVLVGLRYLTPWGRQFWRITRGYFVGSASIKVWLMLGVLLLSVVLSVRLNVLLSYQSNDLSTAVQIAVQGMAADDDKIKQSGVHGFWVSIAIFILLATIFVIRVMADIYLTQRFIIAWRVWLTGNLTDDWLAGRAYYRDLFIDNTIDNPDQRIQQDIDIFTANAGGTPNAPTNGTTNTLLFGAVNAMASVISFAAILWNLSGDLTVAGVNLPRAMFWVVLVYVLVATVVAFWLGRPLIWLSFNNEKLNAAFRYALVRLRDAAEAVGFYRGERVERRQLWRRFDPIIGNYRKFVRRTIIFNGWNWSMSQAIVPLPWVIQAPRLFAGRIHFGDVTQTAVAFGQIEESLSFFRNNYDAFASFRAAIIRLHGLVDANSKGRALPAILVKPSEESAVELRGIEVRTPEGDQLVDSLDIQLDHGDTLVITGRSGAGKTTLLRSLAELWPYASGTLCRPDGDNATMFLSQLPYVPLGNLRTVVCYPSSPDDVSDEQLHDVLTKVALAPLINRLDEDHDWAKVLSPGEQQRVAFARILLTKPKAVFLDEATSALDEGLEFALYQLVRAELPECVMVSVSHRPTVEQHHEQQLHLLGGGPWQLGPVEKEPAQV